MTQHVATDRPEQLDGGRLVMGEELGSGAQGAVYAAVRDGQPRAVKLVRAEKVNLRLGGEMKALEAVRHPHVVSVYGIGASKAWHWIEMEQLDGESLDRLLRREGAQDVGRVLAMMFEVCMGLAALHDRGIVHRDIKPANIFLAETARRLPSGEVSPGPAGGRVVIADLGVAQLPAGDVGYLTITGTSLGTVDFAAPEQSDDAKRAGPAADQYGVGATIFAMVTKARPAFLYIEDDTSEVCEACPRVLWPLLRKCCAEEPQERFRDIRQLAVAIAKVHAEVTGQAQGPEWSIAMAAVTPRPNLFVRWWWAFRRWLR